MMGEQKGRSEEVNPLPPPVPPLILAAVRGDEDLVRILLSFPKTEPNATNPRKRGQNTALHEACWRGHHRVVKVLLSDPRINCNSGNRKGYTPLVLAALKGHQPTVTALLSDDRVLRTVPEAVALGTLDADVKTWKAIKTAKAAQVRRFRGLVKGICALRRRLRCLRLRALESIRNGEMTRTHEGDFAVATQVGWIAGFVNACVKPDRARTICVRCAHDPCECEYRRQGTTHAACIKVANSSSSSTATRKLDVLDPV